MLPKDMKGDSCECIGIHRENRDDVVFFVKVLRN